MRNLRIAFRNLSRQKKRSFLLGGAIAFGVLIITLVNSFTAGFVENVQENFSYFLSGHIFLSGYEKSPTGRLISVIRDDSVLTEVIEENVSRKTRFLARRSSMSGVLIFEGESVRQQIVGVDWEEESYLKDRLMLMRGSIELVMADPRSLILNENMADKLDVQIGDSLLVQLQTVSGQQNVGEFVLSAVTMDTGVFSTVSAYAHRSHVNRLRNIESDEYISLGIFLDDMQEMDPEGDRLYRALEDKVAMLPRASGPRGFQDLRQMMAEETWEGTRYQLSTISDFLQPLNQIASVLNTVGLVVVLILFVIIMVGVTNTFRMIIFERTQEIGTMRALGMQRNGVRDLFLLEAILLSLGSAVLGLILAYGIAGILTLIDFGMDNRFFIILKNGHLSFKVLPLRTLMNILIVGALTLLAVLVPALKAARLDPAHALRKVY